MNPLKTRIRNGETTIGAWIGQPSPVIAEAMCGCGFDWMAIDMEHGAVDVSHFPALFAAANNVGCAPLVRLSSADPILARQALDNGAMGLIVPVVEDPTDFANFLDHCLYPPRGKRGVGLARCNRWGEDFQEYLNTFVPVIVPQIETVQGVEVAAELAAIDEVDALFMGPYDLSASLGDAGNFETPEFKAAVNAINDACKNAGVAMGGHQVDTDIDGLKAKIADGFTFCAYGTDLIALRNAFQGLKDL